MYSDEFETNAVGVKLIAVPRDRVVIHLDDIVAAMQVIGVRTDAGTFVSVCVADASGGVSGVGVESVLHSSCAVAEGPLSEIPAGSTVKVRRGSRRWLASWPYLVALFALLGFAIFGIIGSLRRNAIAEDRGVGTALIGMVGLVVLAAVARAQFLTDTPWFTCGQNLHYGWATRPGFARLSLFSAIAVGVSLLIARLSMRYLPRRRVPAGADEHSD